ncbi:uncharacterized protein YebE (UPF0316 family) [Methanolinea mesophila]|uniref:DUF2179 domain-containing protein n=1 Tax=Methanolinea mesophila TaxID=547055 RepID=UPI001FD759D1|nr:DUF5698 domain-containing protein [Methanolinea mesophila]MBP1929000.1 uncharacterized protein YebE (UPF0316 family) [Methanolinea mesophila]
MQTRRLSFTRAVLRNSSDHNLLTFEHATFSLRMSNPEIYLPLIILVARIVETSMETIRTVYISRGHKYLAAGIGVVKVGIWLLSTGLVLTNLQNIPGILAYIVGFGIGTILGMNIEDRISIGNVLVRIISPRDPAPLVERLGEMGYGITRVEGTGRFSPNVSVLLLIVPRKELENLVALLKKDYPDLLFTVEDIRKVSEEGRIFHGKHTRWIARFFGG